jgi:hypothetical protein
LTSRVSNTERLVAPFTAQFVRRLAEGAPEGVDRVQWLAQLIAIDPERVALYMSGRRALSLDSAKAMASESGRNLIDVLTDLESARTPSGRQSRRRTEQRRNAHAQLLGHCCQVVECPLGLPVQPRRDGLPTYTES